MATFCTFVGQRRIVRWRRISFWTQTTSISPKTIRSKIFCAIVYTPKWIFNGAPTYIFCEINNYTRPRPRRTKIGNTWMWMWNVCGFDHHFHFHRNGTERVKLRMSAEWFPSCGPHRLRRLHRYLIVWRFGWPKANKLLNFISTLTFYEVGAPTSSLLRHFFDFLHNNHIGIRYK